MREHHRHHHARAVRGGRSSCGSESLREVYTRILQKRSRPIHRVLFLVPAGDNSCKGYSTCLFLLIRVYSLVFPLRAKKKNDLRFLKQIFDVLIEENLLYIYTIFEVVFLCAF